MKKKRTNLWWFKRYQLLQKNLTAPAITNNDAGHQQRLIKVIHPDINKPHTSSQTYQLPTSSIMETKAPMLRTRYYFWESFLVSFS